MASVTNRKNEFSFEFTRDKSRQIELSQNLEVGDIVFEKFTKNPVSKLFSRPIEALIVISQYISQFFYRIIRNPLDLQARIEHVYQVVEVNQETGQILLAEATSSKHNKLRIISLWNDRATNIMISPEYEFEIVRLKNRTAPKNLGKSMHAIDLSNTLTKQFC